MLIGPYLPFQAFAMRIRRLFIHPVQNNYVADLAIRVSNLAVFADPI